MYDHLDLLSFKSKERILELANKGGAYVGSAYSCVDILVFIYKNYMNISKNTLNSDDRDYFFLSKGHAVTALYSLFVELDFISQNDLIDYANGDENFYHHPNSNVNGIEFHSGSLGHSLSIAAGVALDIKLKKKENKVLVMLGDGELNEGTVWETLQVISHKKLDNLIVIIDKNKFQANYRTDELIPLGDLNKKFEAFNMDVLNIDGHNFADMTEKFSEINKNGKTKIIIADTVRGKGIPSLENEWDKWFMHLNDTEKLELIEELYENRKGVEV